MRGERAARTHVIILLIRGTMRALQERISRIVRIIRVPTRSFLDRHRASSVGHITIGRTARDGFAQEGVGERESFRDGPGGEETYDSALDRVDWMVGRASEAREQGAKEKKGGGGVGWVGLGQ